MHALICLTLVLGFFVAAQPQADERKSKFVSASKSFLGNPHDIELSKNGKLLYVSDVNNNRIAVLDAETLELVGSFGDRKLSGPHDIDLGPDGKLYVADTRNHRIAIYRPGGQSAQLIDELKGPFKAPEGVVVDRTGRIYVAGAWSDNLVVFENGQVVQTRKGFDAPHDLEIDAAGNLWLADANNNRVVQLTPDLNEIEVYEGPSYGFNGPRYLNIAADRTLWVADKYTHRVLAIRPGHPGVAHTIGTGKHGKGPGKLATPEGVMLKGQDLWISDSSNDRIVRYQIIN